jgi:hypothetical protein
LTVVGLVILEATLLPQGGQHNAPAFVLRDTNALINLNVLPRQHETLVMYTIMELLEIIFRSFWHFIGFMMLLSVIAQFLFIMWNRTLRHWNIRKHGYPPKWCDADGDFKNDEST